jgi:hypothetical protein
MPQAIAELVKLQQYVEGVIGRAGHHAREVNSG